ncbi:MAG: large conductance mechanosensitive channel protein MscL [Acidimicrobiales bacterium]
MSSRSTGMLKEFKDFILQGDVVMLAVAVVIGLAFQAVVKAVVADILTPLIGAIFGTHNFEALQFTVHHSVFLYGDVLNNLISLVFVGLAVFLFVVKPYNAIMARRNRGAVATTRPCPACLTDVPVGATRCSACTSDLPPLVSDGAV